MYEMHKQSNERAVADHNASQSDKTITKDNTDEDCCSDLQFEEVSRMISREQFNSLAIHLGIDKNKVQEIEVNCTINQYGDQEIVYRILRAWRQRKGSEATQEELIQTLFHLQRRDIVKKVFPDREIFQGKAELADPVVKSIQDKQREYFKDLQLPRILWLKKKYLPLEELYVKLTMRKKGKTGTDLMETIALEDMFQMGKEKENRHQRIFIEGHPGFGKTTLLMKILSDWSREHDYVSGPYYLVFLISLRNFKGDLDTHFHQQCHRTIDTKEEVALTIRSIEEKVLLLLDGWDEATKETKKILVPLLRRFVYPKMTVVVTSRTGFHDWPQEEDDILCEVGCEGYEQYKAWDKRIQVEGISRDKRKEFLRKYLKIDLTELDRTIYKLPICFDDFYCCPLFLLLLGTLIKQKKFEDKQFETKTQLYKNIFNFVINRSLVRKENLKKHVDIDLFDLNNSHNSFYKNILIDFGRLCLQKLKIQSLSFEESEILVNGFDVYDLGFLTKIVLFAEDEEESAFESTHKSFLEFLAAFYLSTISETEIATEVTDLFKARITPTRDQLVYQFLCGLLDSDAVKLFRSLLPFNDIIRLLDVKCDFRCTLEPLLNEIVNSNEETYKSLIDFCPKYLISDDIPKYLIDDDVVEEFPGADYIERWVGPIAELSNEIQIMKEFTLTEKCLERIRFLNSLKSFRINKMIIDTEDILELAEINKEFKCRELVIQDWREKPWKSFANILERLTQFCFWDRLSLTFNISYLYDEFIQVCKELTNGGIKNSRIYQLSIIGIERHRFHSVSSSIADLLKANIVPYGITLWWASEDELNFDEYLLADILNVIVSGRSLSLSLDYTFLFIRHPVHLPSVIFKSQRQWKYLELKGHFIKPVSDEEMFCTPINDLNCINFNFDSEPFLPFFLSKCDGLKKLSCCDIEQIQGDILNGWKGFVTIESLELNNQSVQDTSLSLIARFQNLKKLKINELRIKCHKNTRAFVVDILLKMISSLPHLTTLSLQCEDIFVLYNFLERLSCLTDEEKTKILLKKLILNSCRVNPFPMHEIMEEYKWITRHKKGIPKLFTEIQRKQYKRDIHVPGLTWLEGDALIDSLIVRLECEDFRMDSEVSHLKSIDLADLFYSRISRILVEGSSHEENKIFCCKFLRYWTEHYYHFHDQFSIPFHIEVKDFVNGASIEDLLIKKFPGNGMISKNDIRTYINAYQHRILLILDGYSDDMNEETGRILEPLLLRRLFPKMNIMVTSNNGNSLVKKYVTQTSKQTSENDKSIKACFDRRVFIKHFDVRPSIELFEEKWLSMRDRILSTMNSIDSEWATLILNSCPHFFPSLYLMIARECSTCNYKNYFNFLSNTLFNAEKAVDLFGLHSHHTSFSHEHESLETLIRFGNYALQNMINNEPATIGVNDIIVKLGDESILRFGILVNTTKFYEPIDESIAVFLAAFSTFNVFRLSGEEGFKMEIERVVLRKSLLPIKDNNILFFRFLGGLLNDRATLLLEAFLPFSAWFNLQNKSFTKILLEIFDIHPFVNSFRPLLTSFHPPLYDTRKLDDEYRSSSIHSLFFNVALLIKHFGVISLKKQVTLNDFVLYPDRFYEDKKIDGASLFKCRTLRICFFGSYFIEKWSAILSVVESIQREETCLYFQRDCNSENSSLLNCLYKELTEGQWKEKTIQRVLLTITENDDPKCLHQLVDLVKNNKIKEAVYVRIRKSKRNQKLKTLMASVLQDLFESIILCGNISEFSISNDDSDFSPIFDFSPLHGEQNSALESVYLHGSLSALNEDERSTPTVEEALILCRGDRFVQNLQGIKWLKCYTQCFDCLVKEEWQHLNKLEELTLTLEESISVIPCISNFSLLRVLTLDFNNIKEIPNGLDLFLYELLYSLDLKILQLITIPGYISNFDWLVECILNGLDGKKENSKSNDTPLLDELLLRFSSYFGIFSTNELKESKGMIKLHYLLRKKLIRQFSSIDCSWGVPGDVLPSLFPLDRQFTIKQEVHGSNPSHSRHSQWEYRWMEPAIKYCITSTKD